MTTKLSILRLVIVCAAIGLAGCEGYYTGYPGYGPYYGNGPYYGTGPYYGNVAPAYGYPGSVAIEIGDRPYYVHGAGYYVGRTYYVWRPGHWAWSNGQRVWVHGRYIVR
jgi:hypothetical protein